MMKKTDKHEYENLYEYLYSQESIRKQIFSKENIMKHWMNGEPYFDEDGFLMAYLEKYTSEKYSIRKK